MSKKSIIVTFAYLPKKSATLTEPEVHYRIHKNLPPYGSLSWASWLQSTPSYHIPLNSTYVYVGCRKCNALCCFSIKIFQAFLVSSMRVTSSLIWSRKCLVKRVDCEDLCRFQQHRVHMSHSCTEWRIDSAQMQWLWRTNIKGERTPRKLATATQPQRNRNFRELLSAWVEHVELNGATQIEETATQLAGRLRNSAPRQRSMAVFSQLRCRVVS
jgi:hypothetical protein